MAESSVDYRFIKAGQALAGILGEHLRDISTAGDLHRAAQRGSYWPRVIRGRLGVPATAPKVLGAAIGLTAK
jgi:hypothetical protein